MPTAPTSRAASLASPSTKQDSSSGAGADTLGVAQDWAPWVNYVLAWTFCVQAVLIGTILSTAPLLLHGALGLGVLHVGFAFAGVYPSLLFLMHDWANHKEPPMCGLEAAAEPLKKQGQRTTWPDACPLDLPSTHATTGCCSGVQHCPGLTHHAIVLPPSPAFVPAQLGRPWVLRPCCSTARRPGRL